MRPCLLALLILCLLAPAPGHGHSGVDLAALSLEELLTVEVFTASRHEQPLFETQAAVEVINADQIRRSGAVRLTDLLRLATGIHAKHIDASKWSVTVRGSANRFANKLLVLIDGRTVYSPLFAGVLWETQDLLLDDIDRIEVIRGPGGTLWGANAVNGVINVITRRAAETQGTTVWAGGGPEERGFAAGRHGGRLTNGTAYRVYGKGFRRDALQLESGEDAADEWQMRRGGFRLDHQNGQGDWLISGGVYDGRMGQTMEDGYSLVPPYHTRYDYDTDLRGGHLLTHYVRTLDPESELTLTATYDGTATRDTVFSGAWQTLGLDIQHRRPLGRWQTLVWGAAARSTWDDLETTPWFAFTPDSRRTLVAGAFAQSEIRISDPRWRLTVGTKLEHNDYTGVEVLPNLRAGFTDGYRYAVWGALSRAVRLPTRAEADGSHLDSVDPLLSMPGQPLAVVRLVGDPDMQAEELTAWELGARWRAQNDLTLDVATFFHQYDRHFSGEPRSMGIDSLHTPARIILDLAPGNLVSGTTRGVEVGVEWQPHRLLRLRGGYAYLHMDLSLEPESRDPGSLEFLGDNPRHRADARAALDLPGGCELDLMADYLGRAPDGRDDRILTVDAHLSWRPVDGLTLSLTNHNLLGADKDGLDPELIDTAATYSQRSIYLSATWQLHFWR